MSAWTVKDSVWGAQGSLSTLIVYSLWYDCNICSSVNVEFSLTTVEIKNNGPWLASLIYYSNFRRDSVKEG